MACWRWSAAARWRWAGGGTLEMGGRRQVEDGRADPMRRIGEWRWGSPVRHSEARVEPLDLLTNKFMNLLPLISFGPNLRPILLEFLKRVGDPIDWCEPLPPLALSYVSL